MLGVIGTIFTGYFFYYFSGGPDFGAKDRFPVILPLVALSARGLEVLERAAGPRAMVGAAVLVVLALALYVPWRATDKYFHYRGMRPDLRSMAVAHGFGPDLVLVNGSRFPDYASAAVLNPVDLHSDQTVYAWDRSPDVRAAVLQAYADRRVWLVDGPSVTKNGYRLAAGPVAARVLLGPAEAR